MIIGYPTRLPVGDEQPACRRKGGVRAFGCARRRNLPPVGSLVRGRFLGYNPIASAGTLWRATGLPAVNVGDVLTGRKDVTFRS